MKCHILQLVSTITIQKPTKICQVSWNKNIKKKKHAKCQSHISTCKQWHMPHITCKRWHKWSNQLLTCATLKIKTFWPIKWCRVSWRKSLKNPPIKLWHVSPIKLHHVLLTYPQTLINRSLPKAFLDTKTSRVQAA